MISCPAPEVRRVLILKADRLYAETLRHTTACLLGAADIHTVCRIGDASSALAADPVDLLLTGVGLIDGDIVDFLSTCIGVRRKIRRVLVITSRRDQCVLADLRSLPIDGVFDPSSEGVEQFGHALRSVVTGIPYWSPSVLEHSRHQYLAPHAVWRQLTPTEQVVLSVIGDGSDDHTAAKCLGLKTSTILSVRGDLHRKLGLQHRGELMRHAVQNGFVRLTPEGVIRPGFKTRLAAWQARRKQRMETPGVGVRPTWERAIPQTATQEFG